MARTVPKGEDRGPRNSKVTVYLTDQEIAELERLRDGLGFRSNSAMAAFILGGLAQGSFTGASFVVVGNRLAKLIDKAPGSKIVWGQINPLKWFRKKGIDPKEFEEEYENERKAE